MPYLNIAKPHYKPPLNYLIYATNNINEPTNLNEQGTKLMYFQSFSKTNRLMTPINLLGVQSCLFEKSLFSL